MRLTSYRPILFDKQAEMHALASLSQSDRARMQPLLQIRHPSPPTGSRSKSPEAALFETLQHPNDGIVGCWGTDHAIAIDFSRIRSKELDGPPFEALFERCSDIGIRAVPVTARSYSPELRMAAAAAARRLGNGACIRLTNEELGSGIRGLSGVLSELDMPRDSVDLVLDVGNIPDGSTFLIGGLIATSLKKLVTLPQWRSVAMVCTSFPLSLSELVDHNSFALLPRVEAMLWRIVSQQLDSSPDYGDYGVISADPPPGHRGAANLRYTSEDNWYVLRGENPDLVGSTDYLTLAKSLADSDLWRGEGHCAGCRFIYDQLISGRPGNATQWRESGFEHHFAVVLES